MEYHFNMKDVKKYDILKQVIAKQLKGTEAAILQGYHPVHISRLKKKIKPCVGPGPTQGIF